MMNELKVFVNEELGIKVRCTIIDGKEYFVGNDIAKALGYSNTSKAINDHCRCVTKRYIPHPQSKTKTIETNFITEGDVYRLIIRSKLPSAEKFETWVMDEVLPSIRKNGGYISDNATDEQVVEIVKNHYLSKYCTDEIHDRRSVRNYIRQSDLMKLEETVQEIINVVQPMKGSIKNEIIDTAIKELKKIDEERYMDSAKNTYIKTVAKDSVIVLQDVKIGKKVRRISTLESKEENKSINKVVA